MDNALSRTNMIALELDDDAVPMVYPYLTNDASLRQRLIDNRVFVATYWPNVIGWVEEGKMERALVDRLIPLPIDQRYGKADMERVIEIIKQ